MTNKELLGLLSLALASVNSIIYFLNVLKKRTHPHAFSWLIWGFLTAVACYAQYSKGAGPGAWPTGFVAMVCFVIGGVAMIRGEKNITREDVTALAGALLTIPAWYLTQDPLYAVILVIVIDTFGGYYPTFRKSYVHPHDETIFPYALCMVHVLISIFAVQNYSLVTVLYPCFVITANGIFVIMVMWRRHHPAHRLRETGT